MWLSSRHQISPFLKNGSTTISALDTADFVRQGQLSRLTVVLGFITNPIAERRPKPVIRSVEVDVLD
jgi:hypothetical protein